MCKMSTEAASIAEFLIRRVAADAQTPGASLGVAVKREFPDISLRVQYGGLQNFIDAHCSGQIVAVGRQGHDVVYARRACVPDPNLRPPVEQSNETAWRSFSNPHATSLLGIEPATGELRVVEAESELPQGYLRITRLTDEEHKQFAREFRDGVEDTGLREALSQAIDAEPFWPAWVRLLSQHREDGIFQKWMAKRTACIISSFRGRLETLGVSTSGIDSAISQIRPARKKWRRPDADGLTRRRQEAPPEELRRLLELVVQHLSVDDLRRIRVPLGAVLDAWTTHR